MNKIASVISWVFMPLLMPYYALLIVLFVPSFQKFIGTNSAQIILYPATLKWIIAGTFLIFSVITPGLSFVIMYRNKMITDIEMWVQKERNLPIITTMIYAGFLYFILLGKIDFLPKYFYALPLAGMIVLGINLLYNRFSKISLHASGAGIFTGFLFAFAKEQQIYQFWILIAAVLVSGLICTTRMYLEKHKPHELIAGYFISVAVTFLVTYFYPIN